ncbi:hypothetical protein [Thermococcus barophilus]|uniref:Uncharacterized protein n=1 Tax=Thermococcus barophilus (strain DSM 11836 / MP) TaxID=391623 RepID=F0LN47_THEBM|nr:hypothetical protein [Thermococcus barophilus]ADT85186.1 hypothetical protein TERMP_02213 [Thermococcus barophilus MP]
MKFEVMEYPRTCKGCKNESFRVIKCHREYLKKLMENMRPVSLKVMKNFNRKAPDGRERDEKRMLTSILSGLIAEKLTANILNIVARCLRIDLDIQVDSENINVDTFNYEAHNDIKLTFFDKNITLEVRSSIPYALDFGRVLNEYFDILGPYLTSYKPKEYFKDYYIRVLFHYPGVKHRDIETFTDGVYNEKIQAYFVGGASREDMERLGKDISQKMKQKSAKYWGISPITRGRDAIEIISLIFDVEENEVERIFK